MSQMWKRIALRWSEFSRWLQRKRVWRRDDLTPTEKMTLLAIITGYRDVPAIMRASGLSRASVYRSLKTLRSKRLVRESKVQPTYFGFFG